jgi:hypothetical protein
MVYTSFDALSPPGHSVGEIHARAELVGERELLLVAQVDAGEDEHLALLQQIQATLRDVIVEERRAVEANDAADGGLDVLHLYFHDCCLL